MDAAAHKRTIGSGARRALGPALAVVFALLALAPGAGASVGIGVNVANPVLRVDAKRNAEISWTAGGKTKTILIPFTGPVLPGGKLSGPDVSRPASPGLPFERLVRSGPGGWLYALQTWPVNGVTPELRFSRWQGSPTKVTLITAVTSLGIALSGRATAGGKPVPLTSRTPGGLAQREYVYLATQVGSAWKSLGGVSVKAGGTYKKVLYGEQNPKLFRAGVAGPNVGTMYAPDAIALTPPP